MFTVHCTRINEDDSAASGSINFHLVVWLAGNPHKLSEYMGERSMGRALTLLHDAFGDVQGDGALLFDDSFIMNIFSPLYDKIPPL